jgi:hypothetical protein
VADAEDVRAIASSLPGVVEIESAGFDFRVGGRGFVWSYPERRAGRPRVIRTDVAVLHVGDEAEKQALLRLDRVTRARLEELVLDAWRMRQGVDLDDA